MQQDKPRKNGPALMEKAAECQIWKLNGETKGAGSKRYRLSRVAMAKRYLQHKLVSSLN